MNNCSFKSGICLFSGNPETLMSLRTKKSTKSLQLKNWNQQMFDFLWKMTKCRSSKVNTALPIQSHKSVWSPIHCKTCSLCAWCYCTPQKPRILIQLLNKICKDGNYKHKSFRCCSSYYLMKLSAY